MADGRTEGSAVMGVRVIAIYPLHIPDFGGRSGVRLRKRKEKRATVVPCRIESRDGRSVAVPVHAVPDGTPRPRYRVQVEVRRLPEGQRRVAHVLLSAEPAEGKLDPEQVVLSPIFNDGQRLLFEFQRARVMSVNSGGHAEIRLVAVHPVRGIIGTKTTHRFNLKMSALATRCRDYLEGAAEIYPAAPQRAQEWGIRVPEGEANLSFEGSGRPPGLASPEDAGSAGATAGD